MRVKRVFIIISVVLIVAILVTAGILTFLQNSFLRNLPGEYQSVEIFLSQTTQDIATAPLHRTGMDSRGRDEFNEFDNALKNTEFRRILGLPEWRFDTSPKFVTDNNGDRVKLYASDLARLQADSGKYMVELFWGTSIVEEITVQDTTIKFDTLRFMLGDSDGRITAVRAYAYINGDFLGGTPEHIEDTYINPFDFYANTTDLYKTVVDLASRK